MEIGNRAFSQIYREYKPGVLGAGSSEHLRSNLQGTKLYTHSAFSISGFSEEATKARQGKWAAGAAYVKGAIDQQFGEGVGAQLFKKISDNIGRDLNKELLRSDLKAIDANIDKIMGENFLDGVKDRFGALNENDHPPAWHSPDLLCAVEAHVWDQVKRGRSLEGAISGLREALAADETLHPGLKAKIGAALDAIVEEVKLHAELRKHDAFMGISQENMWKLFAGGEMQAQGTSKWDLEHCGEGSLAGMQRAFRTMLEGLGTMGWSASKLTANDLEKIHIEGSRGTFRSEGLVLSYKPGVSGPEDQAELRGESRVPEGFRNSDTDLNMRHKQTTKAGREEVERLVEQDPLWFTGVEERLYPDRPQDNAFHLQHAKRSPEECRERTEAILKTYNKEIGKAKTEDDKLLAIAKAVQDLYRSHVFMDGNTRTVVFTLMNRMLLENGLGPAILPEPKAAAGFSREEFANQIRDGQFLFLTKA